MTEYTINQLIAIYNDSSIDDLTKIRRILIRMDAEHGKLLGEDNLSTALNNTLMEYWDKGNESATEIHAKAEKARTAIVKAALIEAERKMKGA